MSGGLYPRLARPVLFRLGGGDAEVAHERTLRLLSRLSTGGRVLSPPGAARTVFGVRFPNPVGLAAGMDKDGRALRAWPALGFGFIEVGTVTATAQPGNDRPRLFRLPASEAIVNRMGFNNAGAAALAARLATLGPLPVPLGISLGKSKATPIADAVQDYVTGLRALYRFGDYFAVNVSSPNTPGLRGLQDSGQLTELLAALRAETAALAGAEGPKPILVKVAPDLADAALGDLIDVCLAERVAGLIATNTTISRGGVSPGDAARVGAAGAGGLSGRPLAGRAVAVVRLLAKESGLPVIGVGGIMHPDDAVRMVDAGARLVQLYSGLIYHGPGLVRGSVRAVAGRSA
ncbi:MAG TPA: quinone-dependent dihydroorotate dehydrogenase [Micromonosporaceae bacterium]|nr:quinone-dependent dihydroorotate dehydrogenase [Micromonosporaceae bacterium]